MPISRQKLGPPHADVRYFLGTRASRIASPSTSDALFHLSFIGIFRQRTRIFGTSPSFDHRGTDSGIFSNPMHRTPHQSRQGIRDRLVDNGVMRGVNTAYDECSSYQLSQWLMNLANGNKWIYGALSHCMEWRWHYRSLRYVTCLRLVRNF